MTIGHDPRTGAAVIELTPAEWQLFNTCQTLVKHTGSASGEFVITLKMTKRRQGERCPARTISSSAK